MEDEADLRIKWFSSYVARCEAGVTRPRTDGLRYLCPCCRYPTLPERGAYEICPLCNWEDDGQDDPHANEVWGGPNGPYSLSQARHNFQRFFVMFEPVRDRRLGGPDSNLQVQAKRDMIAAFDAMPSAMDESALAKLWEAVERALLTLRAETRRKITEYENKNRSV